MINVSANPDLLGKLYANVEGRKIFVICDSEDSKVRVQP